MSRSRYDNGQLIERWDDVTQTYTRYENGVPVETRAYTSAEIAGILGLNGVTTNDREVVLKDFDGTDIFRLGLMEFGDYGMTVRRENGTTAFEVRTVFAGVGQSVNIYDGTVAVVGTDALFGGIRAPYLEHPFQPYSATTASAMTCGPNGFERITTSATFETLFIYDGKRQNPFLNLKIAAKCSDTTTSAEVRVVNLATTTPLPQFGVGSWLGTFAVGSSAYRTIDSGALVAADAGSSQQTIRLGVQARRTAGAGTVTVAVPSSIGG